MRLIEKGYTVLMLEKGSELKAKDFPKTNWDLRRYMWLPVLGFRGLFKMTFFRHVTILSGVGVGGGSLGYACTHPVPNDDFFAADSWAHMADWKTELEPHYAEAKRMLGVTRTPMLTAPDTILKKMAADNGQPEAFHSTDVAIYFGQEGKKHPDPFFSGKGPERTGCKRCGGCMLGCQHGAKNTLDKNYLHFARNNGLELKADTEVVRVQPHATGYRLTAKQGTRWSRTQVEFTASNVIFAGGVLGTVDLLLKMKDDPEGLPKLSDRVGYGVRTNNEALIGVISSKSDVDLSKGIAIGSIYQTDNKSHIEPVRYPKGSGLFRLLMAPHVGGSNALARLANLVGVCLRHPIKVFRAITVSDHASRTSILLYMRTCESTLRLKRTWWGGMGTTTDIGESPTASIPEATALAEQFAGHTDGIPFSMVTETLLNIPTTAHILGGCCIGDCAETGVIDAEQRVYGYPGLYVMDGSAISANPGVNPSLTIVAMTERVLAKITAKA